MSALISTKIGAVFVPVSDIALSSQWYCNLLGIPRGEVSHEGKIYDIPMSDGVMLILDANKPVSNSSQPLCWFWAEDIQAARDYLRENAISIVMDIQDIGSVSMMTFRDPDNNLLMLCQRN